MKHIPLRTCVACRAVRAKRELIRIVRTPEGRICVDSTGKMNGRGAYLCRKRRCWQSAIGDSPRQFARSRLIAALHAVPDEEAWSTLHAYAQQLSDEVETNLEPHYTGVKGA
ncbi:MAG: DUF448 domain-containing protein [Ardenticatenia bacterium]|jgi:predicted RNA-binding protein YlxR (DUF448 family)|nr:MAG: DUF448 domain-containing protein [Ardenticatenia bacterium]